PMSPRTDPEARPRLLLTMGDVAGVGPEIIARGWPALLPLCRPVVVGDPGWLRRACRLVGATVDVVPVRSPGEREPAADLVPVLPATSQDLSTVEPGKVSAAAGRAAYDFLCAAIDATLAGEA